MKFKKLMTIIASGGLGAGIVNMGYIIGQSYTMRPTHAPVEMLIIGFVLNIIVSYILIKDA